MMERDEDDQVFINSVSYEALKATVLPLMDDPDDDEIKKETDDNKQ